MGPNWRRNLEGWDLNRFEFLWGIEKDFGPTFAGTFGQEMTSFNTKQFGPFY